MRQWFSGVRHHLVRDCGLERRDTVGCFLKVKQGPPRIAVVTGTGDSGLKFVEQNVERVCGTKELV